MDNVNDLDLEQLNMKELERMAAIVNIKKIHSENIELQAKTNQSLATIEQIKATVNKMQAETEKARKETSWFPWVQILTLLATLVTGLLTGGVAMYFLTKLMPV
ncbi:hypothetical protein B0181_07915 [Moraxella caviae]|uniref:Uncharacterized protein n=1 Tax=Moraxella caviae TaxID=34060 RepID=A0A1S9ZYW3_9GAMM|nr:hypothetical protein [Moraxella caviae]OOR88633.1 hypothetical protein B0181_07915 [Moraxella caviae]STZ13684.1 Uncharacterised protein [Moraxella caviae]